MKLEADLCVSAAEASRVIAVSCLHMPKWVPQRIYVYKEYKAKSPRLHSADIYPRKQEQELQRTYQQHMKLC